MFLRTFITHNRRNFIINDDNRKPQKVIAGGLIFYKQGKILVQICDSDWEKDKVTDFGGKSEVRDLTPWHMAMREAYEETNGIMPEMIGNVSQWVGRLYVLYMVEVPTDWGDDVSVFGKEEVSKDGFRRKREVKWIDLNDLKETDLTGRIKESYSFIKRVGSHIGKKGYDLQESLTQYLSKMKTAY